MPRSMAVLTMRIASSSVQLWPSTMRCPPKLRIGNNCAVWPNGLVSMLSSATLRCLWKDHLERHACRPWEVEPGRLTSHRAPDAAGAQIEATIGFLELAL